MILHDDIRTLIQVDADPAVSLYLPVHAALPDRQKNAIRLRKLLRVAEDRLRERGVEPDAVLAATRRALEPDPPVTGRETGGLAAFTTGAEPTVFALQGAPREHVAVGRGFDILPLLPFLEGHGRFFVITLDRASPTLYRGTRLGLETVATEVMERSLEAIRGSTELPSALGFHSTGPAGRAGASGYRHAQGESPEDYQQTELDQFAHGIARAVEHRLRSETAPLVPVGEPNLLGMFRGHCRYAGLTGSAVTKSPTGLDAGELFRATLAVADETLAQPVRKALARAAEGHHRGDGTVSIAPSEIADAAEQGRVGTLLLARDAAGAALRAAEGGQEGNAGEDASEDTRKLCDRIVRTSLLHGGEIMPVGPEDLPEAAAMAALFRF